METSFLVVVLDLGCVLDGLPIRLALEFVSFFGSSLLDAFLILLRPLLMKSDMIRNEVRCISLIEFDVREGNVLL